MDKYVELFLDYLSVERGLSKNTILAYRSDLKDYTGFLEAVAKKNVSASSREDIRDFMLHQKDKGLSVNSISLPGRPADVLSFPGAGEVDQKRCLQLYRFSEALEEDPRCLEPRRG
jgi:hypothetical protein